MCYSDNPVSVGGKKTHSISIGTDLLHLEPLGAVTLRNLSAHLKKKKKVNLRALSHAFSAFLLHTSSLI